MTDIRKQNDSPSKSDVNQDGAQQEPKVTHYAYDPQTYEILCRPGQPLREKKTHRLQELNLYAHVVTFVEPSP